MKFKYLFKSCCLTTIILVAACGQNESTSDPASAELDLRFQSTDVPGLTTDHASTGGASWVDYDVDGDLDLFLTNGYDVSDPEPAPQSNNLYRNDGDGRFTSLTSGILLETADFSSGHTWGDYDNDGDPDVYITNQRDRNNLLFRNEGEGQFTRIENDPPVTDGGHSYAAAWVDVDRDGWLDLFVANGGLSHAGPNQLFRGSGEGHFEKITAGDIVTDEASTCGFAWGDYDNDGDPDLFVANQGFNPAINSNALYRNDGDWQFTKILDSPVANDHLPSSAADWVDIDNDQDLDLYVTNLYGLANLLYRNDGQGNLTLVEDSPLTLDGGYGHEANWEDYDNDGDPDLIIANWGSCPDLYLNDGQGEFIRIRAGDLGHRIHHTGSMASADFDADGDIDMYLASWPNQPGPDELNHLYVNQGTMGHWLQVQLVGKTSNRSGIGARLLVTHESNGSSVTQLREAKAQTGFRGQSAMVNHFGVGKAETILRLEVHWPSGQVSAMTDLSADQLVTLSEDG
jgi:hypothetical protein